MFLTQTDFTSVIRSRSNSRSKSINRQKFQNITSIDIQIPKKHQSIRSFNKSQFKNFIATKSPENKWNKIVQLYNMPKHNDQITQIKTIKSGVSFYRMLTNSQLMKNYKLKLNFPETFIEISGQLYEIRTNVKTGEVQSQKIKRQIYLDLMQSYILRQAKKLEEIKIKYKKYYDYRFNPFAPVIVTKIAEEMDDNFQVDVQNYKTFSQRRSRPSNNKIIQRFIYPRNMRAIILRLCYDRKNLGQQRQQYFAYRFQNVDNIFRANKKNNQIYETYKLQSTISATYQREDKVECSKLTNIKGLQKYIRPSKQLIRFLQQSHKVRVDKIYIDYLIDLYDQPWLINIKHIEYTNIRSSHRSQSISLLSPSHSLHIAGSYGICKLCSIQYLKIHLRKSISNKMLAEFLSHLKKRMKVNQYENLNFVNDIVKKNTKNYITLQVCDGCYRIVAEEYKLIQCQQKLAKICNIQTKLLIGQMQGKNLPISNQNNMKQWRLMLYFVGIQNIPQQLLKNKQQIILKYKLGTSEALEHFWKIGITQKTNSNSSSFYDRYNSDLNIKKLKIHYFYSQLIDIDQFLKQTEVNIQIVTLSQQKVIAKGSTGTLSCFGRKFQSGMCLRQTSSILLFYNNGQYCQMTLKVGLICDGVYQIGDNVPLIQLNNVFFTENNYSNSNPIPKQWMEAFGVNDDILIPEAQYQQIMNPKLNDNFIQFEEKKQKAKSKKFRDSLTRKSLHFYKH